MNCRVRGVAIAVVGLGVVVLAIAAASFWVEPSAGSAGARGEAGSSGAEPRAVATVAIADVDGGPPSRRTESTPPERDVFAGPLDSGIAAPEPRGRPVTAADAPIRDPQPASPPSPTLDAGVAAAPQDPTTHRGPEPVGDDPCVVPIYYDWTKRRTHLTPADIPRLTVRLTVENYTTPWWLRPDAPGNTFLWSVEGDIEAKRIQRPDGGPMSVKLRSLRLGTRELKELELPVQITNHPTGGVFGSALLEAFAATIDYERGVLAFNDCPQGSP